MEVTALHNFFFTVKTIDKICLVR